MKAELGGVGIVSGYGMTEAPIVTMASVRRHRRGAGRTPRARPCPASTSCTVKLDGSRAGVGEEGEIRVKGPMVMRGYLDSSLDADAFDADGYFRTGDLGRLDADGNVAITGRVKDIIIRNMENISAKEVEDLLFTHPAVADAAVIGLPDARTGERVCAVVVLAGRPSRTGAGRARRVHRGQRPGQAEDAPSSSRSSTSCPATPPARSSSTSCATASSSPPDPGENN